MKTTNNTPGPWKHDEAWGLIKYGKTEICALHSGNKANAHLIAAAPDLLSAARNAANVLAALATGQLAAIKPDSNALQELRAAIAKAEGAK